MQRRVSQHLRSEGVATDYERRRVRAHPRESNEMKRRHNTTSPTGALAMVMTTGTESMEAIATMWRVLVWQAHLAGVSPLVAPRHEEVAAWLQWRKGEAGALRGRTHNYSSNTRPSPPTIRRRKNATAVTAAAAGAVIVATTPTSRHHWPPSSPATPLLLLPSFDYCTHATAELKTIQYASGRIASVGTPHTEHEQLRADPSPHGNLPSTHTNGQQSAGTAPSPPHYRHCHSRQ